eukprot:1353515-Rhodomonas_salina.2
MRTSYRDFSSAHGPSEKLNQVHRIFYHDRVGVGLVDDALDLLLGALEVIGRHHLQAQGCRADAPAGSSIHGSTTEARGEERHGAGSHEGIRGAGGGQSGQDSILGGGHCVRNLAIPRRKQPLLRTLSATNFTPVVE